MLLTESEIKYANSLMESDAGDIAGVDGKLNKPVKRPNVKPEEKQVLMDEDDGKDCKDCDDDIDEDESEKEPPLSNQEKDEILRSLAPDEIELLKDNFKELLCPVKYARFLQDIEDTAGDTEKFIALVSEADYPDEDEETDDIISDIIAYTMSELDDFSDFAYLDDLGEISERLINPQHIRKLRLMRKKAVWKAGARKRARFRKTGAGRIMKRKAKLYMKKYRRRKKTKLKRYGKELGKYNARMGGK